MKHFIDRNLGKFISRKLLVWLFATGFLIYGFVTSDQWMAITLAYVGVQGFADIATKWKSAGNKGEIINV